MPVGDSSFHSENTNMGGIQTSDRLNQLYPDFF